MTRLTPAERNAQADASYERGWRDSLDARFDMCTPPEIDRYWYNMGWQACADYRWQDRNGRGVAPDRTYRVPRPER